MSGVRLAYIPIEKLRPHERVVRERVLELMRDIAERGVLIHPILVDEKTLVVLDGHHRVEALKLLGAKRVPAVLVDYSSSIVEVGSWRPGLRVAKEDVLAAGLSGKLLPPKTSRHRLPLQLKPVYARLEELLQG